MDKEIRERFFENRDETGRFMVISSVTGVQYFVEPIGDGRGGNWGSYNPSTGNIEHKKGDGKYTGSVRIEESLVTEANGFERVTQLGPGISPMGEIAERDLAYEAQGVRKRTI